MGRRDVAFVVLGVLVGALLVWTLAWGDGFETGEDLAESLHELEAAKARAEDLRARERRELERFAAEGGYVPATPIRVSAGSCPAGGVP